MQVIDQMAELFHHMGEGSLILAGKIRTQV